ncbi:MAG: amidohydrolase family protein [Nitrospirae bacterium]|nr:amidohydrolase family protein [Nitrospirota bacterium]
MAKNLIKDRSFIDLHTHGIGRYDTRTKNPEDILKMAELHRKAGTSAILPTIYSGTIDEMRRNMEAVKKAMEIQQSSVVSCQLSVKRQETIDYRLSTILGVHLEGPFLNPSRCGALNKNSFIRPALSSLKGLIDGYEDIIKIITIAPELPGALKVIARCVEYGFKVNMGHSDATYKQALDGKKAGAGGITHIFNAMRPFHHREPGLIGLGLLDEDLYIEVIADGVHVHPETLRLVFKTKRIDRIILVSDSIKVGTTRYRDAAGALRGSSITLTTAVKILKALHIPEAEAVEAAADNPAKYLNLKLKRW